MKKLSGIYIVGDVHGDWAVLNNFINRKSPEAVILAGDVAYFWKHDPQYNKGKIKHNGTKIYWVPGNHENMDIVKSSKYPPGEIYEVEKNNRQTKVTFAKRGEFVTEDNLLKLKLEDGFRDETSPNNKNELYRLNFKIFFIDMPIGSNSKVSIDKKPSDMTIKELMDKMNHLKKMGVNTVELGKEMHKRLSFSFSIISFIILGFALSLSVRHKEKSVNMGLAFVAVFFGYLLFILAEAIVEYQIIIPSIGMWLPNVIILGIAIFLFKKNAHFR